MDITLLEILGYLLILNSGTLKSIYQHIFSRVKIVHNYWHMFIEIGIYRYNLPKIFFYLYFSRHNSMHYTVQFSFKAKIQIIISSFFQLILTAKNLNYNYSIYEIMKYQYITNNSLVYYLSKCK